MNLMNLIFGIVMVSFEVKLARSLLSYKRFKSTPKY